MRFTVKWMISEIIILKEIGHKDTYFKFSIWKLKTKQKSESTLSSDYYKVGGRMRHRTEGWLDNGHKNRKGIASSTPQYSGSYSSQKCITCCIKNSGAGRFQRE